MHESPPNKHPQPSAPIDGALIFASLLAVAFAVTAIICYVDEFKLKRELEQLRSESRGQVAASIAKQGDMERKAVEVDQKAKNAERSVAAIAQKVGELSEALEQSQSELRSTRDELKLVRKLNAGNDAKMAELARALAEAIAERNRPEPSKPKLDEVERPSGNSSLARALEYPGTSLVWKPSHWQLIKYGQSPGEVRAFAGPPVSEQSRPGGTYWYYIEEGVGMIFIRFENGAVSAFGRGTR
jgi:hypothetical protein